jgi:hypothetical protein
MYYCISFGVGIVVGAAVLFIGIWLGAKIS